MSQSRISLLYLSSIDVLRIFLKVKILLQFHRAIRRPFQSLTPAIEKRLDLIVVRTFFICPFALGCANCLHLCDKHFPISLCSSLFGKRKMRSIKISMPRPLTKFGFIDY